jgi:thiol-disulfide isomerase/thioredoxin
MKRKDALAFVAAGLVVGRPLAGSATAEKSSSNTIAIGKPFPGLTVVARDGTEYPVPATDGRPTLITMFASWCPPCRIEMPKIAGDWKRLNDRLFIIGFDLFEPDEKAAAYIQLIGIPFPVATLATTDADFFGNLGIPHAILISKDGIVRDMWAGIDEASDRDPLFGRLIKVGIN